MSSTEMSEYKRGLLAAAKVCGAKANDALRLAGEIEARADYDADEFARFYKNAAASFNECEQSIRAIAAAPEELSEAT